MPDFRPNLTAHRVHEQLRQSLAELQNAEKNAVLWFTDMMHRKLYREFGYGSIQQYAAMELGFSPSKTSQFLRLSEGLERLPELKKAMVRGELGWTKAREVEKVATAKTEREWITEAKRTSRRELEAKVRTVRQNAKAARKENPAQMGLTPVAATQGQDAASVPSRVSTEIPTEIRLVLQPEQLARYEALLEGLRERGHRADPANLVLAGLEALLQERTEDAEEMDFTRVNSRAGGRTQGTSRTGGGSRASGSGGRGGSQNNKKNQARERRCKAVRGTSRSSYQVLVHQCPRCEQGMVRTTRGDQPVSPAKLAAILCDADVRRKGKPMRAVVPPGLRREILARDGHRCRSAGCRNTHLLEVHHRVKNGSNDPSNLITLCSACHSAVHRLERSRAAHHATHRAKGAHAENR